MARYFNRASSLRGLRDLAAEAGADLAPVMRKIGLRADLLRKPEERVEFAAICALFEQCALDWNMPDLGLRMAPFQHLDMLGPVALVTRMSSDLREALTSMTANLIIHSNAIVATLEEEADTAALTIEVQPVPSGTRQYSFASVGVARNVLEQAGTGRVDLVEVLFSHDAAEVRGTAESIFRCPVRFGSERNALYFDRSALDRPIERSDVAYHALIERYLTTARREVAGRASDEARFEIARQMEFGGCTLESVAQSLRLEPRSLQRRLKREGLTFRDLVDGWRRTRALSLVTNTRLPLGEVSLALGYSEQSIFSRAFQRWYGKAPLAYRYEDAAPAGPMAPS